MLNKILPILIAVLLPLWLACNDSQDTHAGHDHGEAEAETDPHAGHDHGTTEVEAETDPHAGHDHGTAEVEADPHAGHDHGTTEVEADPHAGHDHEAGLIVELTPEAAGLAGLEISEVHRAKVGYVIELPGEVEFNQDRLAHISPRFGGIVLQAHARVGDFVEAGKAMAVVESNESMSSYTITAPISGWVIERHLNPGEYVSEESSLYVIADLSTVWVNLAVYPKDCDQIVVGQTVLIEAVGSPNTTSGTIDYVSPLMDVRTRSATARITLSNPGNAWRPGTFVQASVNTVGRAETWVVEKDAVQYLDDERVVFVADGPNVYRPVQVSTGLSDDKHTEILNGLVAGDRYVAKGAFDLKAKIVTSNLDAHAGHGH